MTSNELWTEVFLQSLRGNIGPMRVRDIDSSKDLANEAVEAYYEHIRQDLPENFKITESKVEFTPFDRSHYDTINDILRANKASTGTGENIISWTISDKLNLDFEFSEKGTLVNLNKYRNCGV